MVYDIKGGAISSLLLPLVNKIETGRIHSIFTRGINIQFDDSHLFLSETQQPLSAFGINISKERLDHVIKSVRVGDLVVKKQHALVLYSECDVIAIHYTDLTGIDLSFPTISCQKETISQTLLYRYLQEKKLEKQIGLKMDDELLEKLDQLSYMPKLDKTSKLAIIDYFLGRGLGLTPSGDDLLMGFTMAVISFHLNQEWLDSLAYKVAENKTTYISTAYFHSLLHDHLSENFVDLVKLLDADNTQEIEVVIDEIQQYGHTSGNDTLYGFWLGLNMVSKS